jgi:amidase
VLCEFKAGLNAYLAALGPDAPVRSLEQVIAFNDRERDRVMPYFGQETLIKSQAKGGLRSPKYRQALATCAPLANRGATRCAVIADALVAPTGTYTIDLVNGDHFTGS